MSARAAVMLGAVVLAGLLGASPASAEDYLNLKVGFPVNGVEYERVLGNGVAWSLSGSYYPLSGSSFSITPDDSRNTYLVVGAGLKRYFGAHRVFYLGAYPEIAHVSKELHTKRSIGLYSTIYEPEFDGSGSATVVMIRAGPGWRGMQGRFTFGGELGGGLVIPGRTKIDGLYHDYESGEPVSRTVTADVLGFGYDLDERDLGVVPTLSVQVYVGYRF